MTVRIWEKPKSRATTADFKSPSTKREYGGSGSSNKTDILTALGLVIPATDTTIDLSTGAIINVFLSNIDCNEFIGGSSDGIWDIVVHYNSTTATVELNFNLGVQTVKITSAIADVRSYNALSPASGATQTAANSALAAADVIFADSETLVDSAALLTINAAINDAVAKANVVGVNGTVKTKTLLAASKATATITDANTASAKGFQCAGYTRDTANSALGGDSVHAAESAAFAAIAAADTSTASLSATANAALATTAGSDATSAIPGSNPDDIAAAAAAVAVASEATSLAANVASFSSDVTDLSTDEADVTADAVAADTVPGATVPDFHRMIGVNGGEVEGIDAEVGKVEISITKKWDKAALAASYLKLLADYTEQGGVNHDTYTIIWLGQILTFARGTLRFRCATVKSDSGGQLEITYNFAYQRNITVDDNVTIGQSAPMVREGWHAFWIFCKKGDSNGAAVSIPQSVHIVQVYPYLDFGALNL